VLEVKEMRIELKDYLVEDKYAQNLAYELPLIAILSSAPNKPGAVIKQLRHKYEFKNLRSRHIKNVRLK